MRTFPEQEQQIRQVHAKLIHQVVAACQNPEARTELEPVLRYANDNGWQQLVVVIRKILSGERSESLLAGLDEEDGVIVRSILSGLQNPATLPDPDQEADASLAAPGLASIIHAASRGDAKALQILAGMAEQMTLVGGDMARLGGIMRKLLNGERDVDALCKGMDTSGRQLVINLLEELNKLAEH